MNLRMHTEDYLNTGYIRICSVEQISNGKTLVVKVGRDEVIIANLDGEYYAVSDYCPHAGWLLHDERLKGEVLPCSLHGSTFNIKTGNVVSGPSVIGLKSYSVIVRDDEIFIQFP